MDKKDSILFLGDIIPFKPFKFRNSFKTVVNLECPIIKNGIPVEGKINLSVNENYLKNIFGNNLLCVNICNNHILDFGKKGLDSTLAELEKINLKWFGLNSDSEEKYHPLIIECNGNKIAFLSAICKSTSPLIELDNVVYLSLLNTDEIIGRVLEIRNSVHRLVVYIHWGLEESSYPATQDILIARKLIEAGVDIIIGSHAHAPQPVEKHKNGIIAYNLGNFIMPKMKNIPSYFDERGMPGSVYNKRIMLWNRISWGVIIDMESLEYRVNRYMFLFNRVIELPTTPLDKYIKLNQKLSKISYEFYLHKHLKKRTFYRKVRDFIYRPYIPQKIRIKL